MPTLLQYGISSHLGEVISVYDAQNGLACDCVCPECGSRLEARQGENNQWHFAHYNGHECIYAGETALHQLAKQILAQSNRLRLPDGDYFSYAGSQQEADLPGMRADILLLGPAETLQVEILVTHAMGEAKRRLIRAARRKALEIDLSDVDRNISIADLMDILLEQVSRKELLEPEEEKVGVVGEKPDYSGVILLLGVALVLGAIWLWNYLNRRRTRPGQLA